MIADRAAITTAIRERADLLSLAQEATGNRMHRLGARYRGPCPLHGGTNPNFSVDAAAQVFYCHTCTAGGDAFAFVQQWRGVDFSTARAYLGDRVGVPANEAHPLPPMPARVAKPSTPSLEEQRRLAHLSVLDALRAEGCVPSLPPVLYAAILGATTLEECGRAYMESRGLGCDDAERYGFRSIPANGWQAWAELLADAFLDTEIALAGLERLPWGGKYPALVIPYTEGGVIVGLRLRNLAPDAAKHERYWSLRGAQPHIPFNADVFTASGSDTLHLVEGEINAYTLRAYGLRAIGLPGAASWRAEWAHRIADAVGSEGRFVAWYDDDDAGHRAHVKLAERLDGVLGADWVARHAQRATLHGGDANDLHRAGLLGQILSHAGIQ